MNPALLLAALLAPPAALACGGGWSMHLDDPLVPPARHVDAWLWDFDGYAEVPAPVTRFLYGVRATDPATYDALDAAHAAAWVDVPAPAVPAPDLSAFHAALREGRRADAHRAALAVVEALMDLPAPLAGQHADALRAPVEYLELEPLLADAPPALVASYFLEASPRLPKGSPLARAREVRGLDPALAAGILKKDPRHPRAASLAWLALRHAERVGIADGFTADDVRANTDPATFVALQRQADDWLRRWPDHPLADHVRLKVERLAHLSGDADLAWGILLEMYPRHPARAADEMRFLVRQGTLPSRIDPLALPPELASSVLPLVRLDAATWGALWRRASASTEPWALPMQERLLWQLHAGNPEGLPPDFPATAAAPTPTWARLRLAVLAREGRVDEAWAQSELMAADAGFVAPIRAWVRLTRGDWVGALREPGLDAASRTYLVRVLAPDDALRPLLDDPELGAEARLTLALRRREQTGSFSEGLSLLEGADPERAALWRQADRLARGRRPDALAQARFLRESAGRIFLGRDLDEVVFYRSLPEGAERAPGLPWTPDQEAAAIDGYLLRSFATWSAIEAYARWLGALDVARLDQGELVQARAVLDEADVCYNALLNYGSSDGYAWGRLLPDSAPAREIRRAGAELRARLP